DGVVITPSHNPPADGGFKYNPPHGGPADASATKTIEKYANAILSAELIGVNAVSYEAAKASRQCQAEDLRASYIDDLGKVINMQAIADAKLRIGVDAMGGAGASYWPLIAAQYGLDITVYNNVVNPSFSFMSLDKDGQIRMDCSSAHAMAPLLALQQDFAVAMGNDPDYDKRRYIFRQ
ncbi:phosphoglucomutase, alpha-D-glucose phosphate-specific, partial [Thalassospira xiamenensis]